MILISVSRKKWIHIIKACIMIFKHNRIVGVTDKDRINEISG